jgi:hypothetical protein
VKVHNEDIAVDGGFCFQGFVPGKEQEQKVPDLFKEVLQVNLLLIF